MTQAEPADIRRIADAVLYEGYILWPYRRSAIKNTRRFTFGGVFPEAWSRAHPDDLGEISTQVLLEAGEPGASVDVCVRFLQVVDRRVARVVNGRLDPVDELEVDGELHVSWDEAVEREIRLGPLAPGAALAAPIALPAGEEREELGATGALLRSWEALEGGMEARIDEVGPGLHRVSVRVVNHTPWEEGDREGALRRAFASTHVVLHAEAGRFVSMTDVPEALAGAAAGCSSSGVWPVLVGAPGERHTMLASPIILEDHPRVAPESPGDLFDSAEVDQLLVLNILSLTDEEKAEMRAADPRARAILDRTEALSQEEQLLLHGAIRDLQMPRPS